MNKGTPIRLSADLFRRNLVCQKRVAYCIQSTEVKKKTKKLSTKNTLPGKLSLRTEGEIKTKEQKLKEFTIRSVLQRVLKRLPQAETKGC